jgi:hypothetical protein
MNCNINSGQLHVTLPITTPTGKVRVKRPVEGASSDPVACRSTPILNGDYLEWQISYDTDSLNEPSALQEVEIRKPQGVRYGCELVWLLKNGKDINLISQDRFNILQELVNSPLISGIEESEKIERSVDMDAVTIATERGFQRNILRVPNYLKIAQAYSVEIKIAHKQRAVGNQAMIYVNLPISSCQPLNSRPIVG